MPAECLGSNESDKSDTKSPRMPPWTSDFFAAYAASGQVKYAAEVAGISREAHYHQLRINPAYQRAFEERQGQAGQMLEDLAIQRVCEGKLVLYQGQPIQVDGKFLREHDTHLHCVLLRRFLPDRYKERVEQHLSGEISLVERLQAARQRMIAMPRNDDAATG